MTTNRALPRWTVALVCAALAGLAGAPTAAARLDDSNLRRVPATSVTGCPLERLADQFVRCDNLTGGGVPAPSFVPQAH